ncbi:MAG: translation elongation factor Ts [Helicobacteraceae bacterium]|jgi:elongation factor Ts|nr:translation elongation factor Ts [Helicobacteraceae bacterium]
MAAVTPELIKRLREGTNAGMLDCKKALVETDGDIEAAVEWLRKKGLSKAAKVADKVAAEGAIALRVSGDCKSAALVEINCETDFVAKNDSFTAFANETIGYISDLKFKTIDDMKSGSLGGKSCDDFVGAAIAKLGEKIDIRRFVNYSIVNGVVNGYLHSNSRVGTIVAIETTAKLESFARDIAMHAAAMKPPYLNEAAIPSEAIAKEREIAIEQLKKEGKPEAMLEKIALGKIKKFIQDNTLEGQAFVKDDKKSVAQALDDAATAQGASAKIVYFARFEVGEGIEKKSDDFAAEVAAQTKR